MFVGWLVKYQQTFTVVGYRTFCEFVSEVDFDRILDWGDSTHKALRVQIDGASQFNHPIACCGCDASNGADRGPAVFPDFDFAADVALHLLNDRTCYLGIYRSSVGHVLWGLFCLEVYTFLLRSQRIEVCRPVFGIDVIMAT